MLRWLIWIEGLVLRYVWIRSAPCVARLGHGLVLIEVPWYGTLSELFEEVVKTSEPFAIMERSSVKVVGRSYG